MGIRGLQAWPETGSWWELMKVLERARLVWTSFAAKSTECTWSLEASFFTLWESRPSFLKAFRVWVLSMVPPTPKIMMWRVTEALWRILQRPLCCSCAALSWICGLVSSQYLISMRWMPRWRMLKSLGRCCLGNVDLLVAAGCAAEVLLVLLSCPLPLLRTHSPSLLACCFFCFRG